MRRSQLLSLQDDCDLLAPSQLRPSKPALLCLSCGHPTSSLSIHSNCIREGVQALYPKDIRPRVSGLALLRQARPVSLGVETENLTATFSLPQHDLPTTHNKPISHALPCFAAKSSCTSFTRSHRLHAVPARPGGEVTRSIPLDRFRP
jgi:hypothetical protein